MPAPPGQTTRSITRGVRYSSTNSPEIPTPSVAVGDDVQARLLARLGRTSRDLCGGAPDCVRLYPSGYGIHAEMTQPEMGWLSRKGTFDAQLC
jgi:hypothetical protein